MSHLFHHLATTLKTTFRNFQKHRLYSSLNIAGLAIAFTTLILVVAYLYQETSYESFYSKADRIYRPTHHISGQNNFELHFARVPVNYINQLPVEIPEIEKLIRFQNQEQKYVRVGDKRFKPKHAYSTDADIFELFDLAFVAGDPTTALSQPNTVVLTETTAKKYFSRTDVLGAYHIDISPMVYGLAILLVYAILGITIYLQTLRATVDNPVQALGEG